jgi:flavin-dependent dehydrogenase
VSRADVLVAGAGPAGALAAMLLARRGLRVRVFDRAVFPRDKLCGDTLNPGALGILRGFGATARFESRALPIRGMVVTGDRGVRVSGEYGPGVHGLSIVRRELDAALLEEAVAAGAVVEQGVLVRAPIVETAGGRPRVVGLRLARGRGSEDVRAPITLAADGRRSCLAFALGLLRQPAHPRRWAIGAYFDGVPGPAGYGEMHVRAGRYVGVSPVPGGLTNACVVVAEPRAGALAEPGALLLATLRRDPLLADRFASARMVTRPTVLGPLAVDASAAGMPGLLLAGDAAGFIDPMTGDGLRFAFRGAELAAEAAARALADGAFDPVAWLDLARRSDFGAKWRLDRALRALVASPRAVTWAARGARLCPPLVRRLISAAGDVGVRP